MSRRSLALLLFLLTLSVSWLSILHDRQLGWFGGMAGNSFPLGLNLRAYGTFGARDEPTVFKAPGYPAFIAAVLALLPQAPVPIEDPQPFPPDSELAKLLQPYAPDYVLAAAKAVYVAQAVVLAASAALLFLWLSPSLRPSFAFAAALIFGTNAYSVVHVGLLHYALLHIFGLIVSCHALEAALDRSDPRAGAMALAGACWGLTTLVRPIHLILPPFVLLILLLRPPRSLPRSLAPWAAFVAGMGLAILPYTLRNYAVSGRLIPVNANAWAALFGPTTEVAPIDPNEFRWKTFRPALLEVESKVAGKTLTRGWEPLSVGENLRLEDAFKEAALDNIRRQPGVYLANGLRSFVTLNRDMNTVFIRAFQILQDPGANWRSAIVSSPRENRGRGRRADGAFSAFASALTLLGAGGLLLAVARRDAVLLVPGLVYLSVCVAHAVSWMDIMYYYVKLPFLFVFAFYLLDRIPWAIAVGGRTLSLASVLMAALTAVSLALTVWVVV